MPMRSSKYHNRQEERDGIRFDSRKEAMRYDQLLLLKRNGIIRKLKLQPQFTLQESFIDPENGERVRAIRYVADFSYEMNIGLDNQALPVWRPVVEDVKSAGTRTKEYEIKKKLLRERFGLRVTEV